jgi:hypothetical protein
MNVWIVVDTEAARIYIAVTAIEREETAVDQ